MVGAGVDVRTAAGRLGHTPEMLLRVYADFMPSGISKRRGASRRWSSGRKRDPPKGFVIDFLPGLLTQVGIDTLSGTLHLHATHGPTEWWIDLDHDGLVPRTRQG